MNTENTKTSMPSQSIELSGSFSPRHHGLNVGHAPMAKFRQANRLCQFFITFAVSILAALTTTACFGEEQTPQEGANVWAKAEAKIETHLKDIDPKVRYAELKSERLSKYLSKFRVFVRFDKCKHKEPRLFLINQNAEITSLVEHNVAQVAEFLRARMIRVESQQDACEFAQLFEELAGAPGYVESLHYWTKDFTVIEKEFIKSYNGNQHTNDANWKFTGVKREGGWEVSINWAGDSLSSIIMPPFYELDIDQHGNFRDLRQKNYLEELMKRIEK